MDNEITNVDRLSILLFDADFATVTGNALKPEEQPRVKAQEKERIEKFKSFMNGTGKVLLGEWRRDIRKQVMAIVSNPSVEECNCSTCILIRQIRYMQRFCIRTEEILSQKIEEEK